MLFTEALRHRDLFGKMEKLHPIENWSAWETVYKGFAGIALGESERELFSRCTSLNAPRRAGYDGLVIVAPVQVGKTEFLVLFGIFLALRGKPGEVAAFVCQDQRGGNRTVMRAVFEAFDASPILSNEIVSRTADSIGLRNGVLIATYPCRSEALRGIRACFIGLDELAFFQTSDGRPNDTEMLRVAMGRVAMTHGKIVVCSSPYGESGALWNLHKKFYGRDANWVVWQADAMTMNPLLSQEYFDAMRVNDPVAFESDVLGRFRKGGQFPFLTTEVIDDCTELGIREMPPQAGTKYHAFADPSSGSGEDAFTLAVAHFHDGRSILDGLWTWLPDFNPSDVIPQVAAIAKRYGLHEIVGDRYAANFVTDGFRRAGISYRHSEKNKSELYLELLPLLNSGQAVLLDDPDLHRELRGLQRRSSGSGRDHVDHARGSHDDLANAVAGALLLAVEPRRSGSRVMSWPGCEPEEGWFGPLEYRRGAIWSGTCPPDLDRHGVPVNKPAVFENGKIVRYLD